MASGRRAALPRIEGVVSLLIALAVKRVTGLRVPQTVEEEGIDAAAHAEEAYAYEPPPAETGATR